MRCGYPGNPGDLDTLDTGTQWSPSGRPIAETGVLAYRLDRDAFMEAVTGHRAVFELAEEIVGGHTDRDAACDQPPSGDPGTGTT